MANDPALPLFAKVRVFRWLWPPRPVQGAAGTALRLSTRPKATPALPWQSRSK